jgi:hypothetical protein
MVLTVRGNRVVQISRQYETRCGPYGGTLPIDARIAKDGHFSLSRSETVFIDDEATV